MSWKTDDTPAWSSDDPTPKQMSFLRKLDMKHYGKFKRPKTKGEAHERIEDHIRRQHIDRLDWEGHLDG